MMAAAMNASRNCMDSSMKAAPSRNSIARARPAADKGRRGPTHQVVNHKLQDKEPGKTEKSDQQKMRQDRLPIILQYKQSLAMEFGIPVHPHSVVR